MDVQWSAFNHDGVLEIVCRCNAEDFCEGEGEETVHAKAKDLLRGEMLTCCCGSLFTVFVVENITMNVSSTSETWLLRDLDAN